jgi:hypothetical protein
MEVVQMLAMLLQQYAAAHLEHGGEEREGDE